MSKSWAIAYSSKAGTLILTSLHLIEDRYKMLAVMNLSIGHITYPIYEEKLWLLAKNKWVNTTSRNDDMSNRIYFNLLVLLSACHYNCLFKVAISPAKNFID